MGYKKNYNQDGELVIRGKKKLCNICKKWKPFSEYFTNRGVSHGLMSNCKVCEKVRKRIHREENIVDYKYREYVRDAKRRNNIFELTKEQFVKIIQSPCVYCGDDKLNGVDRVDNNKGYTVGNSVSCCGVCNRMKLDHTTNEFIKQCIQIIKHTNNNLN